MWGRGCGWPGVACACFALVWICVGVYAVDVWTRALAWLPEEQAYYHVPGAPNRSLALCPGVRQTTAFAVVTYLNDGDGGYAEAQFEAGLCKMARRIDSMMRIDRIVLVLSPPSRPLCGWQQCLVTPIEGPPGVVGRYERYYTAKVYTKLYIWALAEYSGVLYLDADTLPLRQFGQLFSQELPVMARAGAGFASAWDGTVERVNTGVMLVQPNASAFSSLVGAIATTPHDPTFAEQNFLNAYFSGRIHVIPQSYNGITVFNPPRATTIILHYPLKPWHLWAAFEHGLLHFALLWHWL